MAGKTPLADQVIAQLQALGMNVGPQQWSQPSLVPVSFGDAGGAQWAMPSVASDFLSALALPGDVAQGKVDPMSDEGLERATGFAANVAIPGLTSGAAATAAHGIDPNLLSIFAGPKSMTADMDTLAAAKEMAARSVAYPKGWVSSGLDPESIWNETGWFQGADGMWRYEIPDPIYSGGDTIPAGKVGLKDPALEALGGPITGEGKYSYAAGPVSRLLQHEELFKAYPDLANVFLRLEGDARGIEGYHTNNWGGIPGNEGIHAGVPDPRQVTDLESVILHELQHGVQQREGFASGGNPDAMRALIANLTPNAADQLAMPAPMDLYRALAGEVEARNVQTRFELGPETSFPMSTADIPEHFQLSPQKMIEAARDQTQRPELIKALQSLAMWNANLREAMAAQGDVSW